VKGEREEGRERSNTPLCYKTTVLSEEQEQKEGRGGMKRGKEQKEG
jgi:hypothetical protein